MPDPNAQAHLRRGGIRRAELAAAIRRWRWWRCISPGFPSARADLARDTAKGPHGAGDRQQAAAPRSATSRCWPMCQPYQQATLYAKVSGYLGKVLVDKGDKVKAGQLLATIESQETDAQYDSAARRSANKKHIAQRYGPLVAPERHRRAAKGHQADADARVAQAVLSQICHLKCYERHHRALSTARSQPASPIPARLMQNATNSQTARSPSSPSPTIRKLRIDAFVQQQDGALRPCRRQRRHRGRGEQKPENHRQI